MNVKQKFRPDQNLKLLDQIKQVLRYHHYSYRTEQTYCNWIVKFLKFHQLKKHPRDMGKKEIDAYLSHLAVKENVAVSTQRQAMNAILFLYHHVLDIPISDQLEPIRAKRQPKLPVVMTQQEVRQVLSQMKGIHLLMANILYGSGLRLMECIRLRVQDLDFDRNIIYVRAGKGGKDRTTLFPDLIKDELKLHIAKVKALHEQDLALGYDEVFLPNALHRKYPNAAKEFRWQYVFPSKNLSKDPRTGAVRRHHVLESGLQKAVRVAVQRAKINKPVSCHTFRHSFATHLLENNVNIRVVQQLMGHTDVKTTEIYTHVMDKDISKINSPLDNLENNE